MSITAAAKKLSNKGFTLVRLLGHDLHSKTTWYEVETPAGDVVPMTAQEIKRHLKKRAAAAGHNGRQPPPETGECNEQSPKPETTDARGKNRPTADD